MPLHLCLQADEQGALSGKMNLVKIAAISMVRVYRESMRFDEKKNDFESLRGMFDLWLQIEHPDAWRDISHMRESRNDEIKLDELSAESMDEMIEKIRRLADMT